MFKKFIYIYCFYFLKNKRESQFKCLVINNTKENINKDKAHKTTTTTTTRKQILILVVNNIRIIIVNENNYTLLLSLKLLFFIIFLSYEEIKQHIYI